MLEQLRGRHVDAEAVVPGNPDHARTLERADAVLANPKIRRILSQRDAEMKASFARGSQRLSI